MNANVHTILVGALYPKNRTFYVAFTDKSLSATFADDIHCIAFADLSDVSYLSVFSKVIILF